MLPTYNFYFHSRFKKLIKSLCYILIMSCRLEIKLILSYLILYFEFYIFRYIIQMIENKGTELGTEPIWQGYMYSLLLFITLSLNSILFHISFHHMMTLGLKAKTALICLIYKKVGSHYENTPMQYLAIFTAVKMIIFRCKIVIFFLFLLKT